MDLCEGIYDVTSFALNRAYKDVVKPLADIYNKASDIMDKIPTPVKIAAGLVGGAIAIGTGIAPAIVAGTMIKAAVSGAVISGAMYGVSSLFTGNFDKKEFVNSMLHGATDMFMISGVTLGVKGVVDCVTRNSGRIKSFLANESGEISVSKGGRKTDFYVTPSGEAVPATGYRYMDSKKADDAFTKGEQFTTYIGFEKLDSAKQVKDRFQIADIWSDCKVRGEFDTLQAIDNMYVPTTQGNTTNIPEPITFSYPQFGSGGAYQLRVDKVIKYKNVKKIGD